VKRFTSAVVALAVVGAWAAAAATAGGATRARIAPTLTPAQQCVKDGHAIPTVSLPGGVRAVRGPGFQTVGGWAFLDANTPIVGGRVQIVGPRGAVVKLLPRSTATTKAGGTFLVAVRSLPRAFQIRVLGGRRNGSRFNGTLVAAGTTATAYVSPVSTILSAYRLAYPRRTLAQATSALRRTLAIPAGVSITTGLRFTNQYFAAQKFLARGPFARTVQAVVRQAAAGRRLAFPGRPGLQGAGTELLKWGGKQLANGAVAYIGGKALGWVLGQLGIGGDGTEEQLSEIKSALDGINTKLAELGQQLKDLKAAADKQLLETLVIHLKAAESAVTGKLADLQVIAQMAAAKPDKAYLESQSCAKLAGLYPLASGTVEYGYVPDLLNHAFFPGPTSTPLTTAIINVVKGDSRWFTSASSDQVSEMVGYWQGLEQSWLQVELEWEHAVHPCPATPTPNASNCLALYWAGRYSSDTQAQTNTLPRAVPGGMWIDMTNGLAWAPAYAAATSVLPHPPPATYAQTFGPRGDWIGCPGQDPRTQQCGSRPVKGLTGACQDGNPKTKLPDPSDIDVCAVELKSNPGPFDTVSSGPYGQSWSWYPPSAGELGTLVNGYREAGFSSPLEYLTKPWSDGGAGAGSAWFEQGLSRVWTFPCPIQTYKSCEAFNLTSGGTSAPGDGKAGLLLTSRQRIPETRYCIVGGSTQFTGGGPSNSFVRYVSQLGSDTTSGRANDCASYLLPCKTLTHAVDVAGYATTIELGAGTFAGPVTLDKGQTIVGAGAGLTTIDGGGGAAPTVTIGAPASIYDVTITRGNPGIRVNAGSRLTLVDSVVAGNKGPGVVNQGTAAISGTTIATNADYGFINQGTATLANSTISANSLSGLSDFGATVSLTLVNDTVTQNGYFGVSGGQTPASMTNTLLAANDAAGHGLGDCNGSVAAGPGGHDLIAKLGNCEFDQRGTRGNLVNTNAKVGPLGPNGGPTSTVPLLAGSPAIGAGDAATCAAAPVGRVDQRDYVRPSGSCDIGAYDSKAQNIPTATG
jgi:Right handed beta helix region